MTSLKQQSKLKKIKLVISDVDGVLTDGSMYYSSKGEELKKFHTRDGMGVELLLEKNIPTILISKEKSKIVTSRAKKIRVSLTKIGIIKKENELSKICAKFNVKPNEIAYIGDDVNDKEIMKLVGFSAAPKDAIFSIKKIANYTCLKKGGEGAFRELADIIISSKK
jgi:3-deoxy-D-manno-octulosonate 8-phosphate phosphatase (KDO 8-P phosphatase)